MSMVLRQLAKDETLNLIRRYGLNEVEGEVPDVWPRHIAATAKTWIAMADDELVGMWGIIPPTLLSQSCYLWLSTTSTVKGNEFLVVRHSQRIIEGILKDYPEIIGDVKVGADHSVRWIKWLGATFGKPAGGFIPFTIRKKHG